MLDRGLITQTLAMAPNYNFNIPVPDPFSTLLNICSTTTTNNITCTFPHLPEMKWLAGKKIYFTEQPGFYQLLVSPNIDCIFSLFLVPILWIFLSKLSNGRPRLPPSTPPTPPTPPTTPGPRDLDPLEDFVTFLSFCSKEYADQSESDLN